VCACVCLWYMNSASLSLYKILFHFKVLLLWESIILVLPPLGLTLPYCNIIARPLRNIRLYAPHTVPPFSCHTLCNVGDGNIVQRPRPRARLVRLTPQLSLYTILPLPILYGVWHKREGRWWGVYCAMVVH